MQDKSAMQQMIDRIKFYHNRMSGMDKSRSLIETILTEAMKLLEVEEKNIANAFEDGFIDNSNHTNPKFRDGHHYYSTKYNNQR